MKNPPNHPLSYLPMCRHCSYVACTLDVGTECHLPSGWVVHQLASPHDARHTRGRNTAIGHVPASRDVLG